MITTWRNLLFALGSAIGILMCTASSVAQSSATKIPSAYEIALQDGLCAAAEHSSSVLAGVDEATPPPILRADFYAHLLSLAMCNRGAEYSALIRSTPSEDWQATVAEWDYLTDEGMAKHPDNCVAILFRADAQRRSGQISSSTSLIGKLKMMRECPRQVIACALLIEAHSLLAQAPADESGQARDLLERSRELYTESSAPLIDLGFYYLETNHFVRLKAKTYFDQALDSQRDPNNFLAKLGLAKAEGSIEAFNEAKEKIGIRTIIRILKALRVGGVASAAMESIDEKRPYDRNLSILYPEATNESKQ